MFLFFFNLWFELHQHLIMIHVLQQLAGTVCVCVCACSRRAASAQCQTPAESGLAPQVVIRSIVNINTTISAANLLTMCNSQLTSAWTISAQRNQPIDTLSATPRQISDYWTKHVDSDKSSTELPAAFSFECSSGCCQPSKCFHSGNSPLHLLNHAMHCSPLNLSKALWIYSIRKAAKRSQNTPVFS